MLAARAKPADVVIVDSSLAGEPVEERVARLRVAAPSAEIVVYAAADLGVPVLRTMLGLGVKGLFDNGGRLRSMGIQCAFCHSTVDDSFAPGIGKRLDGWANRDLNVGAIVSLGFGLAASVGVQLNAPVVAPMLAPEGAPTSENVSVWGGRSVSVALAVNV